MAAARGACLHHKTSIMRYADATYGTDVSLTFDYSNPYHDEHYLTAYDGIKKCTSLFGPYIEKGCELDKDRAYYSTFTPLTEDQTSIGFNIYSTIKENADYVKDKRGNVPDGMTLLGDISIDLTEGMHLPHANRKVELILDFSSSEIRACSRFIFNGKIAKATIDFLSTREKVKEL